MSKIQAAVFDVDGTLFDYHDKKIHDSTVKAVRRLKEDGTVIIIASGRSYPLLGREVCSYRFTFDQTKTVVEISKAYGCGLLLKYNDHSYLYNKSDEMFQVFNNIGLSRDAFIECPSMDHHREELPIGFTIRGCEEAKAILSGQKDQFRVELFHDVTECDVFSPYVNKMTGLKKLSHLLGLDSRQCIAFGDSRNDLEMIRWAGCGIAMGNACQELKDCADLVCGNSWENGIADAVGRIRAERNSPHRLSPLIVVK